MGEDALRLWTGRNALVTGGATRIGRTLCLTLAKAGVGVAVHYRTSSKEASEVVDTIRGFGGRAVMVQADLSSGEACRTLVSEAASLIGPLGLLVNNASIFNRETLMELSECTLVSGFWPNLFGPVLLSRYFAEDVEGNGVIINLLDRRIKARDTRFFAYSLAKKGLADFTELAAVELAPRIKVFGIAPGPILPPPGEGPEYLKEKSGRQLLADELDPQAIAGAMTALLGLRGATGQILYIDNGQHLLGNGV